MDTTIFPVCFSCADNRELVKNQHYTGTEINNCLECGRATDGFIIETEVYIDFSILDELEPEESCF